MAAFPLPPPLSRSHLPHQTLAPPPPCSFCHSSHPPPTPCSRLVLEPPHSCLSSTSTPIPFFSVSGAAPSVRVPEPSHFEILGNFLPQSRLHKNFPWRSAQKGDKVTVLHAQRILTVAAAHGDTLGNNNIRLASESGNGSEGENRRKNHVPLYVMLPLDTVSTLNTLNHVTAIQAGLRALKLIGVDGVMMHVWWGIVEGDGPKIYDWSAYLALVEMINSAGLKVQASMCFHGCGGLGDGCIVSLPPWILSVGDTNPDIFYADKSGNRNLDCLSLAIDSLPLLKGRSPMQMYADFLQSFREAFALYLGNTIVEVVMGLGPNGELRYPSYTEVNGRWGFPGVGEFQCYDQYMLENLKNHAAAAGNPEWGLGGPHDAPSYNQWPNETGFSHEQHGSWQSSYGDFFLSWYSGELIAHGDRMLNLASSTFKNDKVVVAGKIPGVYWWYKTRSHAAELLAGFYNTEGRDGYDEVAKMFMRNATMMVLPCIEMSDIEQPCEARCSPELLLLQIRKACAKYGVPVAGENSLPRFDHVAHMRIKNSVHRLDYPYLPRLAAFTFLRMGASLFYIEHWRLFVNFARNMDKDVAWGDENDQPPEEGQERIFLSSHSNRQEASLQLH